MSILRIVIIVSGLVDAFAGVWFVATSAKNAFVGGIIGQGTGLAGAPQPLVFLSVFLGLVCFLGAALHVLILYWLMQERDEAYAIINVYGGYAILAGGALLLAFLGGSEGLQGRFPTWVPIVILSLRGALLVTVGNAVRFTPNTLRELRLPAISRKEPSRSGAGSPSGRFPRGGTGRGERRTRTTPARGAGRGGRPAPRRAQPGTAPVAVESERDGDREEARSQRQSRGGRSTRGSRDRRGEVPAERARESEAGRGIDREPRRETVERRPAISRANVEPEAPPMRERDEGRASGTESPRGRSRGRRGGAGRSRSGRSVRPPERQESERSREAPPPPETPPLPPPAVHPPEDRESRLGPIESPPPRSSAVRIVTPGENEPIRAGRRPKKGRRSFSGALFRPRETRRVYRHLGTPGTPETSAPERDSAGGSGARRRVDEDSRSEETRGD